MKEYLNIIKMIALLLLKASVAAIPYFAGIAYSEYTGQIAWQLIGLGITLFVLVPIWCVLEK